MFFFSFLKLTLTSLNDLRQMILVHLLFGEKQKAIALLSLLQAFQNDMITHPGEQ